MKANLLLWSSFWVVGLTCGTARGGVPGALEPVASVHTDAAGRLIVNDKPFFPIFLYDAPRDEATLKELAGMGFNALTLDSGGGEAMLREQGLYTVLLSGKPRDLSSVLIAGGVDSPLMSFKGKVVEQTVASNRQRAALCPGRPVMNAIGYWPNEPAGVVKGVLPNRGQYEDLVAAIDVAAPYLYPVPYQPVGTVGDAVARARMATGGRRMVLPILQLFTWEETSRYPTPAELKCMVYLSLIEGATGIGYYTYHSRHNAKHPLPVELWESVKPLNAGVAKAAPYLLKGTPFKGVKPIDEARGVRGRVVALSGGSTTALMLFANTDKEGHTFRVMFDKPPHVAHRLDQEGEADPKIKDRQMELKLEPMEAMAVEFGGW